MLALFDMEHDIREVTFVVNDGEERLACSVTSVSAEDGSGESWFLRGMHGAWNYTAYYNSRNRRGWIEVESRR